MSGDRRSQSIDFPLQGAGTGGIGAAPNLDTASRQLVKRAARNDVGAVPQHPAHAADRRAVRLIADFDLDAGLGVSVVPSRIRFDSVEESRTDMAGRMPVAKFGPWLDLRKGRPRNEPRSRSHIPQVELPRLALPRHSAEALVGLSQIESTAPTRLRLVSFLPASSLSRV